MSASVNSSHSLGDGAEAAARTPLDLGDHNQPGGEAGLHRRAPGGLGAAIARAVIDEDGAQLRPLLAKEGRQRPRQHLDLIARGNDGGDAIVAPVFGRRRLAQEKIPSPPAPRVGAEEAPEAEDDEGQEVESGHVGPPLGAARAARR
jgi:hypothetical protein